MGNWVFSDANGSTYLNDTSVTLYYIIGGATAIGVRNGVVVSSVACNSGGGGNNSLLIEDCTSALMYTAANAYSHSVGDVIQYQVGTPGSGAVYCGTVTQINQPAPNDASTLNAQTYGCNDSIHCAT